jgi:flagellar export protein FliJ
MAYRFRFQALLKYRQHLLTLAQTDLATARRHHEAVRALVAKATAEREQTHLLFQEKQCSGIKVAEYHLFKDYLISLEQQLLQLETELQESSKGVDDAKEVLLQRERELKMLEITDAKDRSAFRKAQFKKEQLSLDERAIMSDYRKRTKP